MSQVTKSQKVAYSTGLQFNIMQQLPKYGYMH